MPPDHPAPAFAIVNARVWTADPRRPWADALLVAGGRLEAVGSSAEVRKRVAAGARVVDARGGMVLPAAMDIRREAEFLARSGRRGDGTDAMRAGTPASFVLLDRDLSARGAPPPGEAGVVLHLAEGRVVHDPDGLLLP